MDRNGNLIYAVDFDGTISFGKFPGVGEPNEMLIEFLKSEKKKGARLILYTCRRDDDLVTAIKYCIQHGLEFEYANENLPELVEYYGGDTRKINADYYIDDRAFNPTLDFIRIPETARETGENMDFKREIKQAKQRQKKRIKAHKKYLRAMRWQQFKTRISIKKMFDL